MDFPKEIPFSRITITGLPGFVGRFVVKQESRYCA
jgi:hypothetical protein